MKSSFLPTYEQKIVRISALSVVRAEILTIFCPYFGRNLINSFRNKLTFNSFGDIAHGDQGLAENIFEFNLVCFVDTFFRMSSWDSCSHLKIQQMMGRYQPVLFRTMTKEKHDKGIFAKKVVKDDRFFSAACQMSVKILIFTNLLIVR